MYEYTTEVFAVGLNGFAPVDNDRLNAMSAEGWEPAHMAPVHGGFAAVVLFRRAGRRRAGRRGGDPEPEGDGGPHPHHPGPVSARPSWWTRATMVAMVSRPGGRGAARRRRGKSGLHRAGCWLTASRGDPQESATESRPPMATSGEHRQG